MLNRSKTVCFNQWFQFKHVNHNWWRPSRVIVRTTFRYIHKRTYYSFEKVRTS